MKYILNMKHILNKILLISLVWIGVATFFNSCEDPPKSDEKVLTSLVVRDISSNNLTATIVGTSVSFANKAAAGTNEVTIQSIAVSDKATVDKAVGDVLSVNNASIRVTAEDGTSTNYSLTINVAAAPPPAPTKAILTNLMETNVGADNITVNTTYAAGNNATTKYGFVYSSTAMGDALKVGGNGVSDNTLSGAPTGTSFNAILQNLSTGTLYYVRAYAINSAGTAYSNQISSTTAEPISPVLGALSASGLTPVAATFVVPITTAGNFSIREYGIVYSTTLTGQALTVTITGSKIVGTIENPTGSLTVPTSMFTADTRYYARAYMTTSDGTIYSNNYIIFNTPANTYVTLTGANISNINVNSLDASVNYIAGNNPTNGYGFVYSETLSSTNLTLTGVGISTASFIGMPNGDEFSTTLANLTDNTSYYIRAYAINNAGTTYSNTILGSTLVKVLSTASNLRFSDKNLNSFSVTANISAGNVTTSSYGFVYSSTITGSGLTIAAGNVEGNNVFIANNNGSPEGSGFSNNLTGALSGARYYVRAYVTNVLSETTYSEVGITEIPSFSWQSVTPNTIWSVRRDFGALTLNDQIYVIGGINLQDVWKSSDAKNWTQVNNTAGWHHRDYPSSFSVHNNALWAIGINSSTYKSADGSNWQELSTNLLILTQNTGVTFVSTVSFSGSLFILGGMNLINSTLNRVSNEIYTLTGTSWKEFNRSGWDARIGHSAVVFKNKIWILGGRAHNEAGVSIRLTGVFNDIWSSSDGRTWTETTSGAQWSTRYDFATAVYDNKLWVIGGRGVVTGNDGMGRVEVFNDVWWTENGTNWYELPTGNSHWSPRSDFGAVVFNGSLYIMGGADINFNSKNDVWRLNIEGLTLPRN